MKLLFAPFLISLVVSSLSEDETDGSVSAIVHDIRASHNLAVEIVDFDLCGAWLSTDNFYRGIITGFSLTTQYSEDKNHKLVKILENEMRVSGRYKDVSNYNGPSKSKSTRFQPHWNTWKWLAIDGDVREGSPWLTLHMIGGMGHTYIPLIAPAHSGLEGNKAYMLHIVPKVNNFRELATIPAWRNDIFWFDGNDTYMRSLKVHVKYIMSIDLELILKELDSFTPMTHIYAFWGSGAWKKEGYDYDQTQNFGEKSIGDVKSGNTGEFLCNAQFASETTNFKTFRSLLEKTLPWIAQ